MGAGTSIVCPGCGLRLPGRNLSPAERLNASGECQEKYYELTCWTLVRHDGRFIHQHAVDAYAARHGGGERTVLPTAFGLIGLCLALEKGFTGRQVQLVHVKMGKKRRDWPVLEPPEHPAGLTVNDVVRAGTDREKEEMLMRWAAAVWKSWEPRHQAVREMAERILYER